MPDMSQSCPYSKPFRVIFILRLPGITASSLGSLITAAVWTEFIAAFITVEGSANRALVNLLVISTKEPPLGWLVAIRTLIKLCHGQSHPLLWTRVAKLIDYICGTTI